MILAHKLFAVSQNHAPEMWRGHLPSLDCQRHDKGFSPARGDNYTRVAGARLNVYIQRVYGFGLVWAGGEHQNGITLIKSAVDLPFAP
jgi:hypothetical protein